MWMVILSFLVVLWLVALASAQWISNTDDPVALYFTNPARTGTEGKYCVTADGFPPFIFMGQCRFYDADSCVEVARSLRRRIPNAECRPNMRYEPHHPPSGTE